MSGMNDLEGAPESPANTLCKACGLCCTGHLFIWTKLRSAELESMEGLGLRVFRSPNERGFSQPCPLWQGQCTIYASPGYPRFCRTYKCKLLKKLLDETATLPDALSLIQAAKEMIRELEAALPDSPHPNFRERLVARLEQTTEDARNQEFRRKAHALLTFYKEVFGVDDVIA
jgi:hypothetical protein